MVTSTVTAACEAQAFVQEHLGEIIAELPVSIRESLLNKFVGFYNEPLTQQLELVLRKRLTDEEVRFLLFAPTPQQYRSYAALLSVRSINGDDDDELTAEPWPKEIHKRFLTLFYFKHARNWPLVVEFIVQDGLQILVDSFMHRDLQVRGQAIDSFVQITSNHVAFEWFEPPVGYEARLLHAKMVALASPKRGLLRQILANIRLYESGSTDSQHLPGSTFVLLQVLAFFLSWVRKLYTQHELRLSRELLTLLSDWGQRTQSNNGDELRLAQQVYEDFSRWPAIEDISGFHQHMEAVPQDKDKDDLFAEQRIAELLREAVETDDYALVEQAIASCSQAIDATTNVLAALLSRAKAYACRAQLSPSTGAESIRLSRLDCSAVWERAPGNMDAWRIQLELLATHAMWTEGCELLDAWHETHAANRDVYLPQDVALLTERRSFFQAKAHKQSQQQQRSKQTTLDLNRQAKEQQIYELLLQRSGLTVDHRSSRVDSSGPDARTPVAPSSTAPQQRDVLARFWCSTTKRHITSRPRTDAPVACVLQTRGLVRQFTKCQRDLVAVRSLLSSSPFGDVIVALQSTLPDASVVRALEALVLVPEALHDADDPSHAAHVKSLLQHFLTLPRLALLLETASAPDHARLLRHIDKARRLVGGTAAAANALAA